MLVDIKPIARSTGESLPVELSGTPDSIALFYPGYRFYEPVTFSGRIANTGDGLLVLSGTVATSYESDCGRCLRPVHGTLSVPVVETYRSRYHADVGRREDQEEDDGSGYRFDGWSIDVAEALRDDLLLSLPARVLCGEDCRGLCSVCFADRNVRDCGHDERDGTDRSPFGRMKELL